jgi:predicted dehydrogenase
MTAAAGVLEAGGRRWRAAIIGHTGRGNYGHNWEETFRGMADVEVAALADADESGRAKALARSGAKKGYADYAEMLRQEKPELVVIAPRHTDQRVAMVTAAAAAGAHSVLEKPFAGSLSDARTLAAVAAKNNVKIQVGHTHRVTAVTRTAVRMIHDGAIGRILEVRARGKEDKRAGGEDLMVLGTHCFDLMRWVLGNPASCFALLLGQAPPPREPIGSVQGREVAAMFEFPGGVIGHFASKPSDIETGERFGVTVYGSRGAILLPLGGTPNEDGWIIRAPDWRGTWQKIEPPPAERITNRPALNAAMARDLMDAVAHGRKPACDASDGLWTIEMVTAVFRSHERRAPVSLPLS